MRSKDKQLSFFFFFFSEKKTTTATTPETKMLDFSHKNPVYLKALKTNFNNVVERKH